MKKPSPNPKSHIKRSRASTVSRNTRQPVLGSSLHSHAHVTNDKPEELERPGRIPLDIFANHDELRTIDIDRTSLEDFARDLQKQHIEDTTYLHKRRRIQHHYRALIEYDRLRYTAELEKINASSAFLDQQDDLDRGLERRLCLQERKLGKLQRRLDEMDRAREIVPDMTRSMNPLFHPGLASLLS